MDSDSDTAALPPAWASPGASFSPKQPSLSDASPRAGSLFVGSDTVSAEPSPHAFDLGNSAVELSSSPTGEPDEEEPDTLATVLEWVGYAVIVGAVVFYYLVIGTPAVRACRNNATAAALREVAAASNPMPSCASDDAAKTPAYESVPPSTQPLCDLVDCGIVRPPHFTWYAGGSDGAGLGINGNDEPFATTPQCHGPNATLAWLDEAFGEGRRGVPGFDAGCIGKLEPIEAQLPLRSASSADVRCPKNRRRFDDVSDLRGGLRFLDGDELLRRLAFTTMKAHLTPPCGPTRGAARKLVIAGGSGQHSTRIDWFMHSYVEPETFEIFIVDPRQASGQNKASVGQYTTQETTETPADGRPRLRNVPHFFNAALWNETGFVTYPVPQRHRGSVGGIADGVSRSSKGASFHQQPVDSRVPLHFAVEERERLITAPAIGAADYLASVASQEDFVVLLLDADGMEWAVAEHLARTGAWGLVDEVFVECHNGEWMPNWPTRHSPADCHRLLNTLRANGVYAHEWFD